MWAKDGYTAIPARHTFHRDVITAIPAMCVSFGVITIVHYLESVLASSATDISSVLCSMGGWHYYLPPYLMRIYL